MNSRAIVIAIVALFALCFVGSGAVMTLVLVERVATGEKNFPDDKEKRPTVDEKREPLNAPEAELDENEDDDDVIETLEAPKRAAERFVQPTEGRSQFAIFYPVSSKLPLLPTLQKQLKGTKLKVFRGDPPLGTRPPYVLFKEETTLDYSVVEGATLEHAYGLDEAAQEKLTHAKKVAVLDVVTPVSVAEQLEVARVVYGFAKATNGVVWDELTQDYFSPDAFKERRVDGWERGTPWAALHFKVFAEDKGRKGTSLLTAGLRRFGVPEIELHGVSGNTLKSGNHVVNVVGQLLAEDPRRAKPGAFTIAIGAMKHDGYRQSLIDASLANAKSEVAAELHPIGDEELPTLELTFPGEGQKTVVVDRGITALFGSNDPVNQVKHDEELLAVSKAQMKEFAKTVKPKFFKGLRPTEVLLVKAPFKTTSGGNEWMWVEVTDIGKNGVITGLLANDPDDVPELESGQEVKVKEAELFDWILKAPDGTMTGNKTGDLMQKRLDKE
ncbi:MAG: DUF2314 domain-containing protein [Archangium sp.]